MKDISVKLNEFPTITVSLGNLIIKESSRIPSHSELGERDLTDQHPISSITGLENALASLIDSDELDSAVNTVLAEAKESGIFDGKDGADGKTAYEYAVDGGYTGSEKDFSEKLASKKHGIHIGPEAPEDSESIWIDTDDETDEDSARIDVVANVGQVIAVKAVGADSKPTEFEAVDLPKVTPPDFSANEGEAGYIKNRTHYIDEKGIVHKLSNKYIDADWMATSEDFIDPSIIIPEQKVTSTWSNRQMDIQPGIIYDVHINGVVYPCEAWGSGQSVYLGNNTSLTRNDYPFCIYWAGGTATSGMFFHNNTLESPIYMKVTGHSYTVYNKLPEEFLPEGVVKTVNGSKPDEKGNVSISTGGGGGGSIDVTAEVGQTIVVEEVDDNGKPTKWKAAEYQPRTHWTEKTVVLPETTCEVIEDIGAAMLPDMAISAGDTLTVVFNGTEYTCECADVDGSLAFGNYGVMDEENPVDTGEPFAAVKVDSGDGTLIWACVPLDGSASFTLSVMGEVHNTIPEKYLPVFGTANVYDIPTEISDNGMKAAFEGYNNADVFKLANTPNTIVRLRCPMDAGDDFVLNLRKTSENIVCFGVISFTGTGKMREVLIHVLKNSDMSFDTRVDHNYLNQ